MLNKKISLIFIGISLILYTFACLLLRWGQTRFIFVPDSAIKSTPQEYNLDYQDVWLDIEQEKIHGWWIPTSDSSAPVLLYFHGNGSNNGDLVDIAAMFHQLGLSVLLIDYRGYGKSSPTFPNETRVYQDAIAAWDYLTGDRNIDPQNIFVYGHSLGGAIAIDLAIKHPQMAGLITEGTFTSIRDMAALDKFFRVFPLDWIINQHFNSITKIKSLKVPLLIIHGNRDELIPMSMAEQLYANAPQSKQLVTIAEANHNNLPQVGGSEYFSNLKQFIEQNSISQY